MRVCEPGFCEWNKRAKRNSFIKRGWVGLGERLVLVLRFHCTGNTLSHTYLSLGLGLGLNICSALQKVPSFSAAAAASFGTAAAAAAAKEPTPWEESLNRTTGFRLPPSILYAWRLRSTRGNQLARMLWMLASLSLGAFGHCAGTNKAARWSPDLL